MFEKKAAAMRSFLTRPGISLGVGAGDALTAKLIERAGFDFVWSSSLCVSAAQAVPDASLLSMNQFVDAARAMAEVITIPVLVDMDTGYGNANNVIFAVKRYEEAGISGICMEDKRFPKDNSLLAGGRQDMLSAEEFAGKLAAAADTRQNKDFVIVARIEALIAGLGQQEAMDRAYRYEEAGADCILIHSRSKTPDEVVGFINNWGGSIPICLVPTAYPELTEDKIQALDKVKLVIYANQPLRAAVLAQERLLQEIKRARGIHTIDEQMVPVEHIFELQGVPQMKEDERRYLR